MLPVMGLCVPARGAPPEKVALEEPLRLVLRGPNVAFEGTQRTEVGTEQGNLTAEVQIVGDGKGRIRRAYRSGPARGMELLQVQRALWQRAPDGTWTRLPDSAETDINIALDQLLRNYRIAAGKPEMRLGRKVIPLRIEPIHPFNPTRHLWLDPQTGLLLKDSLFAPGGRLRSSTVFTALRLTPQSPAQFLPPAQSQSDARFGPASFHICASRSDMERVTGRAALPPTYLPPGYQLAFYGWMQTRSGRKMPALRYTDGLASFTVFQRGMGRGPGPAGRKGLGQPLGSDVQRAVVVRETPSANYLLIGDLTEAELRRVAASLP
jgi:hypothetical protein